MAGFNEWFDTFLSERELPSRQWEITDAEGAWHLISSEVVIEAIHGASAHEQKAIKAMIIRIDFVAGDILGYFKHLAKALIAMRLAV